MSKIPDDSDASNPILEYPGYYLPHFLSTIIGEDPDFELPDWGPLPPLRQNTSPRPRLQPENPDRPPPIEIDPPARPPQWLFGPPRVVQPGAPEPLPRGLPGMIEAYLRGQADDLARRSLVAQTPVRESRTDRSAIVSGPVRYLSSYRVR